MNVNRLGLWLAVGTLVAACSSQSANNGGSGNDGGSSDGTSGEGSGGSSGGDDATTGSSSGGSSGSSSGSGSGGSSGAGSSSGTGSSSGSSSGAGSSSGSSSGGGSGGSSGSSSGGPTNAGTDAPNCGSTPTLHADPVGTLFCSYGADGGAIDCTQSSGEGVCCLGGSLGGGMYAPEMCAATAAGCTNGGTGDAGQTAAIPIACYQVADCTAAGFSGAVACCLQGATPPAMDPGCTYPRSKSGSAVVCEGTPGGDAGADAAVTATGTCANGEVQLCSAQTDCPTGKTCTPGKWKIFQVGFCL